MKRIVIALLLSQSLIALYAQPQVNRLWNYQTSYTIEKKHWEKSFREPLRYGMTDNLEITCHILMMPVMPNLGIKMKFKNSKGFLLAHSHDLTYYSPFLNLVSRKGIGGLISPQFEFPFALLIRNSLTASRSIKKGNLLTLNLGLDIGLTGRKIDRQATIDLPLVYPRLAPLYSGIGLRFGGDMRGLVTGKWFYKAGLQSFIIPRKNNSFFLEQEGIILRTLKTRCGISGGYKLCYGEYPFGNRWQILPVIDFVLRSKNR
jgi:hypothetical protein